MWRDRPDVLRWRALRRRRGLRARDLRALWTAGNTVLRRRQVCRGEELLGFRNLRRLRRQRSALLCGIGVRSGEPVRERRQVCRLRWRHGTVLHRLRVRQRPGLRGRDVRRVWRTRAVVLRNDLSVGLDLQPQRPVRELRDRRPALLWIGVYRGGHDLRRRTVPVVRRLGGELLRHDLYRRPRLRRRGVRLVRRERQTMLRGSDLRGGLHLRRRHLRGVRRCRTAMLFRDGLQQQLRMRSRQDVYAVRWRRPGVLRKPVHGGRPDLRRRTVRVVWSGRTALLRR